ncbi:hypothetical protein T484DRAFT_3554280 [Baffinella frigidus]|nr:hypothetical protein T484DRAFT_3554280 [Cryptophyta sp. CCMP2293]
MSVISNLPPQRNVSRGIPAQRARRGGAPSGGQAVSTNSQVQRFSLQQDAHLTQRSGGRWDSVAGWHWASGARTRIGSEAGEVDQVLLQGVVVEISAGLGHMKRSWAVWCPLDSKRHAVTSELLERGWSETARW